MHYYYCMTSKVLDTISVKESYEASSGNKKARTTTIKSMDNSGSLFVNIHSGRGSVCISKSILPKVIKGLQALGWDSKEESDTIAELKKKIAELEKKK